MNLKELLIKKANFDPNIEPVRIIALEDHEHDNPKFQNFSIGDELGIEVVDFSAGYLRCVNKNKPWVFELYYDKITWEISGKWKFKTNK